MNGRYAVSLSLLLSVTVIFKIILLKIGKSKNGILKPYRTTGSQEVNSSPSILRRNTNKWAIIAASRSVYYQLKSTLVGYSVVRYRPLTTKRWLLLYGDYYDWMDLINCLGHKESGFRLEPCLHFRSTFLQMCTLGNSSWWYRCLVGSCHSHKRPTCSPMF